MRASNQLTINQVAAAFGVSTMTLYLWRRGTPTKEPLPCTEVEGKGAVRVGFRLPAIRAWAKRHRLALDEAMLSGCSKAQASTRKPGPKQKLTAGPKKLTAAGKSAAQRHRRVSS
jgi:hypothetical protein